MLYFQNLYVIIIIIYVISLLNQNLLAATWRRTFQERATPHHRAEKASFKAQLWFHQHTATLWKRRTIAERSTCCKNKITPVELQLLHGLKYFWLHKVPKKHLCNKPCNFISTKQIKNKKILQNNSCRISAQFHKTPTVCPLNHLCPFICLLLRCGGVSDRMGMRQDRIRRTCSLNMALAGSLGHRETRMGTTDLGSVQLSKTRVKPTSCHWDSHNGVKPNKILLSFTPWVTYLDLWKKICTPTHLYVLVHICIHTHRGVSVYTQIIIYCILSVG